MNRELCCSYFLFAKPSLQQWFEYSASKRKNSCPVCKQTCSLNGVNRLYFQSIGDATDSIVSTNALNLEDDPKVLRSEVNRLEIKVAGLTSASERNQKDLKELNEKVSDLSSFFFNYCFYLADFREDLGFDSSGFKLNSVEYDQV